MEENLPALTKNDVTLFKEAIKTSKIEEIENETAAYVKDVFNIVRNRASFLDAIETELLSRISELTPTQLIALVSNSTVNTADTLNKALAPTSALLTAKQQAEAAKANAIAQASAAIGGNNLNELTQRVPQDVLVGLKSLADILGAVAPKQIETTKDDERKE